MYFADPMSTFENIIIGTGSSLEFVLPNLYKTRNRKISLCDLIYNGEYNYEGENFCGSIAFHIENFWNATGG